jgi:type IV pilus assembly protein PilF
MTMFPEPTMRPHPPHSSPPRSRRATFLLRPLAALSLAVLLGACASKEPAPQPQQPTQPEPPPRIQEAPAATRAQLKQELAAGYYERGQMDVALEELDGAVKLDPNNARIYNVYGLVYTQLGENAKAEENFRRALALAPADSEIRQNWGWYLCQTGRPRDSVAEFEAAARNPLYKTPWIALINAGKCSAAAGDPVAAQAYYRRALTVSPNNPEAAYNFALLQYKSANYGDSRALMRIVMLQANPPPEALYLGLCTERKLGDRQSEVSYVTQLRNRWPDSAETRAIVEGTCE